MTEGSRMEQKQFSEKFQKYNLIWILSISAIFGQSDALVNTLNERFADNALVHIQHLVSQGPRPAGSREEKQAARYVRDQMKSIGLETKIEYFKYKSFEFSKLDLEIEGEHYVPTGLGYIPHKDIDSFSGTAIVMDLTMGTDELDRSKISGKAIISSDYTQHFQLLQFQPSLIIYVASDDFSKLKESGFVDFQLHINGKYKRYKSPNVIAQLGVSHPGKKEILIGAHIDSYRSSPGAGDDGSGIGSLIELARHFKQHEKDLDVVMKFIAFGAEEVGILGSRRYVSMHMGELSNCELFFNLDDIAGNGTGAIESAGGVTGNPMKFNDDISMELAVGPWEGIHSYWRCLPEPYLMGFITSVNHPEWLVEVINRSVEELGYEINHVQNLGADAMAFTHAGVVSSGIVIQGDGNHTPKDQIDKINLKSLKKAADITVSVVTKTINHLENFDARH